MSQYILIFYNWIIWNICFHIASKKINGSLLSGRSMSSDKDKQYNTMFLLFAAFSILTFFGGDAAKYKENIEMIPQLDITYFKNTMEYIYIYIALLVNGNFYLWKIIVYGLSLIITFLTIKKLKVDNFSTMVIFVGFNLFSYGATRAILGYAIYACGLSFLTDKKVKSTIIGVVLMALSYFAHSSMALIILLTPLCFFSLSKKKVIIMIALFPVILIGFNTVVSNVLGGNLDQFGDYMAYKLEKYTDDEGGAGTNYGAFSLMIQSYFKFILMLVLLYWSLKSWFQNEMPEYCGIFIKISFYIAYISLLFRFSVVYNAEFLFNRYVSVLPFVIYFIAAPLFESKRNNVKGLFNYKKLLFLHGNYFFAYLCYIAYMNNIIVDL